MNGNVLPVCPVSKTLSMPTPTIHCPPLSALLLLPPLQALAQVLKDSGAIVYLQTKFAAAYKLPEDEETLADPGAYGKAVAAVLPQTASWATQAAQACFTVLPALEAAGLDTEPAAEPSGGAETAGQGVPLHMRTGLKRNSTSAAGGNHACPG